MSTEACLLEPLIEGDSLKILSPQGEVLLVCDRKKGQVFLRYDASTSTLSLQVGEVVLSQKVGEWSPQAGETLVQHFRRFKLDISEDFLSASQRGAIFVDDGIPSSQQEKATSLDYAATRWDGPCLVFRVEGKDVRWDPIRRRLDDRPIQRIRADRRELHGDLKMHYFYYLAFDDWVVVERGKEYFERLSQGDPSNNSQVERAYAWVCDNLRRPYECMQRGWEPAPDKDSAAVRKSTPAEDVGCGLGCLAGLAVLLGILYRP
ncbi:hypothetical protein IV102_25225 [bacterium]|nr:hypothetical protein [bacterium]